MRSVKLDLTHEIKIDTFENSRSSVLLHCSDVLQHGGKEDECCQFSIFRHDCGLCAAF